MSDATGSFRAKEENMLRPRWNHVNSQKIPGYSTTNFIMLCFRAIGLSNAIFLGYWRCVHLELLFTLSEQNLVLSFNLHFLARTLFAENLSLFSRVKKSLRNLIEASWLIAESGWFKFILEIQRRTKLIYKNYTESCD